MNFVFIDKTEESKRNLGFVDLSLVAGGWLDNKSVSVYLLGVRNPIRFDFTEADHAWREFLRLVTAFDSFMGFMSHVFMEDDKQLGFVWLPAVGGALEDWGNGYLTISMVDTQSEISLKFRSDRNLTLECSRMIRALDTYKDEIEQAFQVSFVRH